jgi:putative ABC transport system substrate-binding protein
MRRREFIAGLAGAVAMPLTARAQQQRMPVIGFLSGRTSGEDSDVLPAFRQGLKETGYVEGLNVTISYHFAENDYGRLPALAAELVQRQVGVIVALGANAASAAKAATATIPIIFNTGSDPIRLGLIASLNRPGGNLTGVTQLTTEVGPKRLELLREVVPAAREIALLINPENPNTEILLKDLPPAARTLQQRLHILHASTDPELPTAFATMVQLRAGGLMIAPDTFFNTQSSQLAELALRSAIPTIYQYRTFAAAGGLMSYGGSITDAYRQVGIYTSRVLKGEKPADLPVEQATKVELIINLKTARALGVTVPLSLLGRADEVIE